MDDGPLAVRDSSRKGFRVWISLSCAAAVVGFVSGLVGLGGYGGKYVRDLHIPYAVLLPTSIGLGAIWLVTLVIHERQLPGKSMPSSEAAKLKRSR
jgi:hypothetical protein